MNTWAQYVARLTDGQKQAEVADRAGVEQSTVSRWRRGETVPTNHVIVAAFAQAYGGNVLEAFVAAGFLTAEQAGMKPEPRLDFDTLVDEDPDLSPESKAHIKNQYGLLKAASAHTRQLSIREGILHNPDLDEATRKTLLAIIDRQDGTAPAAPVKQSGRSRSRNSA